MGNCLVTKLKGSVDNIGLPVLNAVKIPVKRITNSYTDLPSVHIAYIKFNPTVTLESVGKLGLTTDPSDTNTLQTRDLSLGNIWYKDPGNDAAYILIPGKEKIQEVTYQAYANAASGDKGYYFRFEDWEYCPNLTLIQVNGVSNLLNFSIDGCFSQDKFPALKHLGVANNTNIYGNLSSLSDLVTLESLSFSNTKVTGDVTSLSRLINLVGEQNFSNGTKVTGDLKTLFDNWYSNGKTSGTVKIWTDPVGLVYDGQPYTHRVWNVTFTDQGHTETNDDA